VRAEKRPVNALKSLWSRFVLQRDYFEAFNLDAMIEHTKLFNVL
jgi:hypothetical protein